MDESIIMDFEASIFKEIKYDIGDMPRCSWHVFLSLDIKVNGVELGEVDIDSAIAGDKGVPVIFVAGDDKCVAEAREIYAAIKQSTRLFYLTLRALLAVNTCQSNFAFARFLVVFLHGCYSPNQRFG